MKTTASLLLLLLLCSRIHGQQTFNDSISQSRNRITQHAMIVLGSWAAANIATGFIIAGQTQGEAKYAWRMNGYWNIINLGLAGMGYYTARKTAAAKYGFADNMQAQHAIEKLYILNFGLDVAYIAGGFFLRAQGKSESKEKTRDQLRGYGTSIAVQGGFLLLMDGVMIKLHQHNSARMNKKLHEIDLQSLPGGLGLSYHF